MTNQNLHTKEWLIKFITLSKSIQVLPDQMTFKGGGPIEDSPCATCEEPEDLQQTYDFDHQNWLLCLQEEEQTPMLVNKPKTASAVQLPIQNSLLRTQLGSLCNIWEIQLPFFDLRKQKNEANQELGSLQVGNSIFKKLGFESGLKEPKSSSKLQTSRETRHDQVCQDSFSELEAPEKRRRIFSQSEIEIQAQQLEVKSLKITSKEYDFQPLKLLKDSQPFIPSDESSNRFSMMRKTELCTKFEAGFCKFGNKCTFAHGYQELQPKVAIPNNYKTKLCEKFYGPQMSCSYGQRCMFQHSVTQTSVNQKKNKKSRRQNLQTIIEHLSQKDDSSSQASVDQDNLVCDAQKLFKKFGRRLLIFQQIKLDN